MVNEVVMYQSMFLLGIVAFGFFSVTFDNYTDTAEDLSFESNLEVLTQEVGQTMMNLIANGRSMISVSQSFEVSISIFTLSQFSSQLYEIRMEANAEGEVSLISSGSSASVGDVSEFKTGIVNGSQINFQSSERLYSSSPNQSIVYTWDGLVETISFRQN